MQVRIYEFITGIETATQPDAGTPSANNDLVTKSYADGLAASSSAFDVTGTHASPIAISNAGAISFTAGKQRSKKYVQGNAGAVTAGSIQVGTVEGQELMLVGCSDTNTVTIDSPTNAITNGTLVLADNEVAVFNWDNGQGKWIEISRNN